MLFFVLTNHSGGGVYCKHKVNKYGVIAVKKELKKRIKRNYKLVLGIIIGVIISAVGVYAATTISSANISYDNKASGLTSTNLKGAIDELYGKSDIRKQGKFVSAYTYSTSNSTKCITGEESTCKKTECYKMKTANSCKAGDIIKYKVNDTDIVTFHVMFDNGSTMTMQSQKNTINHTPWYADSDDNTKGPLTVLPILERATSGWSNVNDQTYTMGTTVFKANAYTGGSFDDGGRVVCTRNIYTLPARTAKARMMTAQEGDNFGCTWGSRSCPVWMYNYLSESSIYGGTVSDKSTFEGISNEGYWLMSGQIGMSERDSAFYVNYFGQLFSSNLTKLTNGARAVVVVNK